MDGYRGQIAYLNSRVLETVRQILKNSKREPIIIMHGDHGPGSHYDNESLENTDLAERYSIFYAAHLPGSGGDKIYDSMSPVNGLRIVLNEYFGTNYELLEDRSFFVPYSRPYDYTPIPGVPAPVVAVHDSLDNEENLRVQHVTRLAPPAHGER
jgi:hypothetical protein